MDVDELLEKIPSLQRLVDPAYLSTLSDVPITTEMVDSLKEQIFTTLKPLHAV